MRKALGHWRAGLGRRLLMPLCLLNFKVAHFQSKQNKNKNKIASRCAYVPTRTFITALIIENVGKTQICIRRLVI